MQVKTFERLESVQRDLIAMRCVFVGLMMGDEPVVQGLSKRNLSCLGEFLIDSLEEQVLVLDDVLEKMEQ